MSEVVWDLPDDLLAAIEQLPPWPPQDDAVDGRSREVDDAAAMLDAALERAGAGTDPGLVAACHQLLDALGAYEAEADRRLRRRLDTLAAIHASLARLRELRSVEAIIARAAQEACTACGFDRAVVYRLRGPELIAEAFHVEGHPAIAQRLLEFSRDLPLRMDRHSHEREMIRRRLPMCVQDVMEDPHTFHPQAEVYDTHSYVAAPILPQGKVIGFVHADHRLKPRRVDDFDRDALWAFAEGLGFAIERARLAERLRAQGDELQRLLRRAGAVVQDYLDAEVDLVGARDQSSAATRTAEALMWSPRDDGTEVDAALSRREREVLALLGTGASNAQIAAQLVISDETAKTHVKRILRKLGAANRVEAAALWLRAQQGREQA
jgi:DNA-binding CsgD family transcriptional regulator/GAF domain-containing protein